MRHGSDDCSIGCAGRMLSEKAAQRAAGPNFDQHTRGVAQQFAGAIGESHGMPQVVDPVVDAGAFGSRDPLARQI